MKRARWFRWLLMTTAAVLAVACLSTWMYDRHESSPFWTGAFAISWLLLAPLVVALLVALAVKLPSVFRGETLHPPSTHPQWYCTRCGITSVPSVQTKGSGLIEVLLWLFMIFPGLIYSIWRRSGRQLRCPACAGEMVPPYTPAAKQGYSSGSTHCEGAGGA